MTDSLPDGTKSVPGPEPEWQRRNAREVAAMQRSGATGAQIQAWLTDRLREREDAAAGLSGRPTGETVTDSAGGGSCSVVGCQRPDKARGLCAMHYQRQRRRGDPTRVGQPGRPRNPLLEHLRSTRPEWSERTAHRANGALRVLHNFDVDLTAAERDATRTNGTVNVSKLDRLADAAVVRWLDEREARREAEGEIA